ncbi:MAG: NAD-dependent epimerase/dehydratase family protein [Gammaproteobacteria bacterium]|nr:MAG: NAD-dependent epimerase/dehydratase family protein [Gammaproteobacteria bacterium]
MVECRTGDNWIRFSHVRDSGSITLIRKLQSKRTGKEVTATTQNTSTTTAAVSPTDGPIAVTGASGYIGSWIVHDLMEQGYNVRACVRDTGNPQKVDHLLAMNENNDLAGNVELFVGDLFKPGSYDETFKGCCAVIHAGATVGYNKETPQQVYDGCFTEVRHVITSVKESATVKRFVFTSSFAAVGHPRPAGYVFTENDWCGDNIEGYRGAWTEENIPKNRDIAYAMAKASAERMIYKMAEEDGSFAAMAILPLHVIGPLMCANHDQGWSWQNCIRFMLQGKGYKKSKGGRMLWNNVDVRDVAKAHRLCAESSVAENGSRYILSASDPSGELFTWQLQAKLQTLFPEIQEIGGEHMENGKPAEETYDSPRAYCSLAKQELGLTPYSIDETIKATVDSYFRLGLLSAGS